MYTYIDKYKYKHMSTLLMAKADLASAVDSEGEEGGDVVLRGHGTVPAHLHAKTNAPSGTGSDVTGDVTGGVIVSAFASTGVFAVPSRLQRLR